MNPHNVVHSHASRAATAIVLAGLVAGSLDLAFAFSFHGIVSGVSPMRVLQTIATGWLGMDALQGGVSAALLGLVSHYAILIIAAGIYLFALSRSRWMRANAVLCGALFGVCIYAFMNAVVLPLSNAPHFKATLLGTSADFAMHVLVIGPAIALVLRRFARRE